MSSRTNGKGILAKEVRDVSNAVRSFMAQASVRPKPGGRAARRQQRRRKAEAEGVNLLGTPGYPFHAASEPLAVSYSSRNTSYSRVMRATTHPELGPGIRVNGRQLLCTVTTTATDSQLFTSSGLATVTINSVNLSPDALNGRLALIARNYSRYAFRRVRLHYIPRVATSDVGGFALGYVQDGVATSFATEDYVQVVQMEPSVSSAFRKEVCLDCVYHGDDTWFTEQDSATLAGGRQTTQGQFIGFPDASSIGAIQHGWLWIEYVVDLYQPSMDLGFTLTARSKEEKEIAQRAIQDYRSLKSTPSDCLQEIIEISGEKFVKVADPSK